jgi:tetratricopeptide (TPR) repeat protein
MRFFQIAMILTILWHGPAFAQDAPETAVDSVHQLTQQAMAYERDGLKQKAAEIYEKLAAMDPGRKKAVQNRLVRLYVDLEQRDKALEWAEIAAADTPDPQAYMAQVHVMLGEVGVARGLLEKEIETAKEPARKMTLLFQLADICQTRKEWAGEVEGLLLAAAASVKDLPEERAALIRLSGLYKWLSEEAKDSDRERYLKLARESETKATSLSAFTDPE